MSDKSFNDLFQGSLMPIFGHGKDVRLSDKRWPFRSGVASGYCLNV